MATGVIANPNEAKSIIASDTLHDTKTSITTDPASIDALKSYDVGIYRVAIPNTTIFPHAYGILEILKGDLYCTARFSTINSVSPRTWRVEWTSGGTWYSNTWRDEQIVVKNSLAQTVITNVADIGLTGTPTINAVAQAMPNGSVFIGNNTGVDTSALSNNISGLDIVIFRSTQHRISALAQRTYSAIPDYNVTMYMASWDSSALTFRGWAELNNTNNTSRENLLSNWYFIGGGSQQGENRLPINTRGLTSYTSIASGAGTLDKWKAASANGTLQLTSSYIRLTSTAEWFGMIQEFSASGTRNRVLTYSVCLRGNSNNSSQTITFGIDYYDSNNTRQILGQVYVTPDASTPEIFTGSVTIPSTFNENTPLRFFLMTRYASQIFDILAVKVEIGFFQTLGHTISGALYANDAPNYADEYTRSVYPSTTVTDANTIGSNNVGVTCLVGTTTSNIPATAAGSIMHYASSSNYAVQLAELVGANGIWTRGKSGGTWGNWRRLDQYYNVNETLGISASVLLSGIVTSNSTIFYGDFVTDKSMADITTVTVTTLNGMIRGVSGYLDNASSNINYATNTDYTVTATKLSNNRVRIAVKKSSAFTNTTNNTPCTYWGSIGLKFT